MAVDETLTSGDDEFIITYSNSKSNSISYDSEEQKIKIFGYQVDGAEGDDTLIITDDANVIVSIDTKGISYFTGVKGREFIFVQPHDQNGYRDYTVATNFEYIDYKGVKTSLADFKSTDLHDVISTISSSYSPSNNIFPLALNLTSAVWSDNPGASIKHEIVRFEAVNSGQAGVSELSDQIKIIENSSDYNGDDIIQFTTGKAGPSYSVVVILRSTQTLKDSSITESGVQSFRGDNNKFYNEETITVIMTDDEYPSFSVSHSNFGQIASIINNKGYNHFVINEGSTGKITINSSKAVENDTFFTISIAGTGGSEYSGGDLVDILVADAATDDLSEDFSIGSSNQIKIEKGQSSVTFEIIAIGDTDDENKEEFSITILDDYSFKYEQDYFIENITPNPYLSKVIDPTKPTLEPYNPEALSGTLNYSQGNDIITLTGAGSTERGLSGDDTYIISNLTPKNSKLNIVDTQGDNTIQITDNTLITKTLFTKNAVRLTLEDSREITINSADKYTYNLGANITSGDISDDLTYSEFASWLGVSNVLDLTSSSEGITDMYII